MSRLKSVVPIVLAALIGTSLPTFAQDRYLNFALRGGLGVAPSYPGADSHKAGPDLAFTFGALKWGTLEKGNGLGTTPRDGISVSPAFKVIGSRKAPDNVELAGLDDIDLAVELGLRANVRQGRWLAFGELRKGVTGHSGVTGTFGADVTFRPSAKWTINAGPRIAFGDNDFANTYFGVSAAEAGASGFAVFDASGGALGAGFAIEANYQISDQWAFNSGLTYEKLLGDAGNSPITQGGSEDQWSVRLGLTRAFTLRF